MNKTVVFTITKGEKGYNVKTKSLEYKKYNEYEIKAIDMYKRLSELTEHFNNELDLAILFEID